VIHASKTRNNFDPEGGNRAYHIPTRSLICPE
jgi:hypothetical protein